jgi:hypothetical protein
MIRVTRGAVRQRAPTPTPPLGDRLAAEIERRLLTPAEAYAPGVVRAARRCGGCTHAQHALGSTQPHPDTGPII